MRRTRLVDLIGEGHWFLSDEAAVAAPIKGHLATEEPPPAATGPNPDEAPPPSA